MIEMNICCTAVPLVRWRLCVLLLVMLFVGCNSNPKESQLTEADIIQMSRARLAGAGLEIVKSRNPILNETIVIEDQDQSSKVLAALIPIESVKNEDLPSAAIDYVFYFQAGKNSIKFLISVDEESAHLKYQVNRYSYFGGDKDAFLKVVEALREEKRN